MVKALFFDIDNTLYSYDKAHTTAMKKLLEFGESEFSLDSGTMCSLLAEAQKNLESRLGTNCAAIHNRLIRFQCFLELLKYPDLTKALKMRNIYWDTFLSVMVPEPGIMDLLSTLYTSHIPMGIGSDQNSHIQYQKLEKLGMLKYFSWIVTSEEAGAEKPSAEFFRLCVQKAGCKPEECVFIGDNLKKDVEGALENGLQGIWYHPEPDNLKTCGYMVIHSYTDFIKNGFNGFTSI